MKNVQNDASSEGVAPQVSLSSTANGLQHTAVFSALMATGHADPFVTS
jgi:hypothetical protein